MPAVAAGSLTVAFINPNRCYTVIDRVGVQVLRDPFTARPHVIFATRRRVGGDVTNFEAIKLLKFST
jgi:HK97 family phage major capsid protein